MNRDKAIQTQIDSVMDEFDFRKVAKYMESVGWTWANYGVPAESVLRREVRNRMKAMSITGSEEFYSGGIRVTFIENKDERWLRFGVGFVIEDWFEDGTSYDTEEDGL